MNQSNRTYRATILLLALVSCQGAFCKSKQVKSADMKAGYYYVHSPENQAFLDNYLKTNVTIPQNFSWIDVEGRVSRVKDQKNLTNNGWAFSVTGALEGQELIRNKLFKGEGLIALSEQDLIDCSRLSDFYGRPDEALNFLARRGGIMAESSYPRKDPPYQPGSCDFDPKKSVFSASGVAYLPKNNIDVLKKILFLYGPVIVRLDVYRKKFISYSGGVYDKEGCQGSSTASGDFMVRRFLLLIGFDNQRGKEIWILKNSMGTKWGDDGYMKLSMEDDCGILDDPVIPIFRYTDSDEIWPLLDSKFDRQKSQCASKN